MNKVGLKTIESGASYQDHIYDFWITVKDSEGYEYVVFDNKPYDLRKYVGGLINLQMEALFIEEGGIDCDFVLIYDGELDVLIQPSGIVEKFHVIRKKDIIFYVKESELPSTINEKGKEYSIKIGRLDLLGFME